MNDIATKMREDVEAAMNEETEVAEVETEEVAEVEAEPEYSQTELEAMDIGWQPDKTDKDGNTLSAEEFIARKPLFNKIRNQSEQLAEVQKTLKELKADSIKMAKESIKEKEQLLTQLKEAREASLDNLEVDEVRKLDKQIDSVQEDIAETKVESEPESKTSPYYADFVSENEWAKNEDSVMYTAGIGLAQKWIAKNGQPDDGNDKPMYDYIHEEMRKEFPEKFKERAKPGTKVGSSNTRKTSSYSKDKSLSLSDVPDDGTREVIKNMARQSGKTIEEYLKNYTIDDFK